MKRTLRLLIWMGLLLFGGAGLQVANATALTAAQAYRLDHASALFGKLTVGTRLRTLELAAAVTVADNQWPFPASGTGAAPTLTWLTDLNTGIHRDGADAMGLSCGGADVLDLTTAGAAVTGILSATGAATLPVRATQADVDDRVVTSADYGKIIILSHATASAVTLPANGAAAGSQFWVALNGDDSLAAVISAATVDTLVGKGDAGLDSVTWGAGHRIGAMAWLWSDGAYWHVQNIGSGTMTYTS